MTDLISCYDLHAPRIESIRRYVQALPDDRLIGDRLQLGMASNVKAISYVWLSATLERFWADATRLAIEGLERVQVLGRRFRPSLFAILCHEEFQRLKSMDRVEQWTIKADMFQSLSSNAKWKVSARPDFTDGKTIRSSHFAAIWSVLGLDPKHKLTDLECFALEEVADRRNDLAHGHIDPVRFGMSKPKDDVVSRIDTVDEVMLKFTLAIHEYFDTRRYTRR